MLGARCSATPTAASALQRPSSFPRSAAPPPARSKASLCSTITASRRRRSVLSFLCLAGRLPSMMYSTLLTPPQSSSPPSARGYPEALRALSDLQSNADAIQSWAAQRRVGADLAVRSLQSPVEGRTATSAAATAPATAAAAATATATATTTAVQFVLDPSQEEMVDALQRLGLIPPVPLSATSTDSFFDLQAAQHSLSSLNQLNCLHITGTKGKGSTSAFVESLLRALNRSRVLAGSGHRLRTGLYTSPHLVSVRERIRIDGEPLSQEAFAQHFWDCWTRLNETRHPRFPALPGYFKFLTLMAFKVFLELRVDVAVLEVGIGGRTDCTNVVPQPVACAVAPIGYDHMIVLGESLDEIAWEKSGIFRPAVPAFTVDSQAEEPMRRLQQRSLELTGQPLIPVFSQLPPDGPQRRLLRLGLNGEHQWGNAALALALAESWLTRARSPAAEILRAAYADQAAVLQPPLPRQASAQAGAQQHPGWAMLRLEAWLHQQQTQQPQQPQQSQQSQLPPKNQSKSGAELMDSLEECWIQGLADCRWPGRAQILPLTEEVVACLPASPKFPPQSDSSSFRPPLAPQITLFIDGAHTGESMQTAAEWFSSCTQHASDVASPSAASSSASAAAAVVASAPPPYRVLLFYCHPSKDPQKLLAVLADQVPFDAVLFCSLETGLVARSSTTPPAAAATSATGPLVDRRPLAFGGALPAAQMGGWQQSMTEIWQQHCEQRGHLNPRIRLQNSQALLEQPATLTDAIHRLRQLAAQSQRPHCHALVVGSLYLVGGMMETLCPSMRDQF